MAITAVLTEVKKNGKEKVIMVHTFQSKKYANDTTVVALTDLMKRYDRRKPIEDEIMN